MKKKKKISKPDTRPDDEEQQEAEKKRTVDDAVKIEPLALEEEFVRLPADLAYWNNLYAQGLRRFLIAKARIKHVKAQLYIEIREVAAEAGAKTTESSIEAAIETHEKYREASDELIAAEVNKSKVGGAVDAVVAKKDMLVSLGAHIRAEMGGSPSVRRDHKDARDIAATRRGSDDD